MDLKLVEEQLKKVPEEIKKVFFSIETAEKIGAIGDREGLLLDQINDLIEETGLTMIGLKPAKQFVGNISKKLNINQETAQKITDDINKEVMTDIRSSIQKIATESEAQTDTKSQQSMADLERVGGFTIEPTGQNGNGSGAVPANLPGAEVVTESKEDLLSGIEDPATISPKSATPEENHTDILVDHLLANPTGAAEEKIAKPIEVPKKAPATDSYREPIE